MSSSAISPYRIDMEIFLLGDMKLDFISFLSDCFRDNFEETLSWGNFRRFQLLIPNKDNWLSIYFVLFSNEQSIDLIVNNFKMYEKRSILLMMYNINEQKSEKHIDSLMNSFLFERDKVYEGIFNKDIMDQNLKKISLSSSKIDPTEIKKNLNFLVDYENNSNLVYKIGFMPNLVNKKTKNYKKIVNNDNLLYDIGQEIFFANIDGEDAKTNFEGLLNFLVREHFRLMKIEEKIQFQLDKKVDVKETKKKKKNFMKIIVKWIDWLIVLYLAIAIYKFFV